MLILTHCKLTRGARTLDQWLKLIHAVATMADCQRSHSGQTDSSYLTLQWAKWSTLAWVNWVPLHCHRQIVRKGKSGTNCRTNLWSGLDYKRASPSIPVATICVTDLVFALRTSFNWSIKATGSICILLSCLTCVQFGIDNSSTIPSGASEIVLLYLLLLQINIFFFSKVNSQFVPTNLFVLWFIFKRNLLLLYGLEHRKTNWQVRWNIHGW